MPNATGPSNSGGSDAGGANSWSIIVKEALGVTTALELSGAAICFVSGSGALSAVSDFFQKHKMQFEKVAMKSNDEARQAYDAGRCDGYLVESSQAVSTLYVLKVPNNHRILQQRIEGATNTRRPVRRAAPTRTSPVDLAYPLQQELKRIGCLTGRVDGVWGGGSRAALRRFTKQAGLRLGSEPSQRAIDEARKTAVRYCQPVHRAAPKRKRKKSRTSQKSRSKLCSLSDYDICNQKAREYCEGDGSENCLYKESHRCLRKEMRCNP